MSDTKISALPLATTPLSGAEILPLVQAGASVRAPVSAINFGLTAPTYAAARLLSGITTGDRLQVLGRTTQSDGGQGLFTWVAGGSTTIDDGFELAAPGGIWQRADMSVITYEMFGAVPMTSFTDTTHDSTAAINACHLALPPPSSTTKKPFRVRLNGLYGISGVVNFLELLGIEFYGISNYSELGSGYIWIAAADPAVDMLYLRGNRYLKFRRLHVSANAMQSTSAAAMRSAFTLSENIITSIQERCTWEDVTIGNRDSYNLSGAGYNFQNGFRTEYTAGTRGNNDFHLFESVRLQNVQYGWNNQESQATGWVARNCKGYFCDTIALIKSTRMTFYNLEVNHSAQSVFVLGLGPSDSVRLYVKGFVSQTNNAEFAVLIGQVDITVDDGNFDCNRDPNNTNIINAAHPLFIDASGSNSTNVIRLINPQFFQIPPLIDFGTGSSLRHLIVKGGFYPDNIAIVNRNSSIQQRIVYEWEPGGGQAGWALAATNWAPLKTLLYPPYTSASVTGVTITGTAGQFAGTLSGLKVGQYLILKGVYGGTGSITGYVNPTTYYVSATDGVSTFTLQSPPGTAIVTTAGTPTGITYLPSVTANPVLHEIDHPQVRFGRRHVSACTDFFNIGTYSGAIGAGATYTFTNALPIGLILGVSLHIETVPAGPANIQIGDGVTAARWGTKVNAASSTQNPPIASLIAGFTDAAPQYNKVVGNVVLTANGGTGTFSGGGIVTLTVHYIDFAQRYYTGGGSVIG